MSVRIVTGDVRERLRDIPDESAHCCVTSPPYFGLRDYGVAGQIGLEASPEEFVAVMVEVFREVRRALRKDGTLWLNLGDSYTGTNNTNKGGNANWGSQPGREIQKTTNKQGFGCKTKDLLGIPWAVATALRSDGWYLRSDIIWHKPNPMPESVTDRPTSAHEHIFLLAKSERYYFDAEAVKEPAVSFGRQHTTGAQPPKVRALQEDGTHGKGGDLSINYEREARNLRNVWTVATEPFSEAHFATFPPSLIEPCIKAGCPVGGTVLDPFGGAGTTGLVADRLGRSAILIELNPDYADMARRRIQGDAGMFASLEVA